MSVFASCLIGIFGSLGDFLRHFDLSVAGRTNFHEFFDIVLLGRFQVISSTTMVGNVKTNFFLQRINAEHTHGIEDNKERSHDTTNPNDNPKDGSQLDPKKCSI
mmetsp:Transcript_110676/g.226408  ORF Transcript_110676/g.226408 Transcript_110676/m.226408 type:complete len:104 (+) Transcript_110676:222-533(+)